MHTNPHDIEEGEVSQVCRVFGTKVFKIYFYTFYNVLKCDRAFEEYSSDQKILQNMIYLFSYEYKNVDVKLKTENLQKSVHTIFTNPLGYTMKA